MVRDESDRWLYESTGWNHREPLVSLALVSGLGVGKRGAVVIESGTSV